MGNEKEQLAHELTQARRRVQRLETDNTLLRDAEQRARQMAETIQAAGLALTKTFDLDTILETLLDHLVQLVPYDSASIFLLEGDTHLVARAARGYERWIDPKETKLVGAVSFDLDHNPRHLALLTTQKSLVIPDVQDDPSWGEDIPSSVHIRNWMGVPLVAGGKTIGLYSLDKTEPHFFTEEHLRLAEALAAQAAVAIQNALLYREAQRDLTERQQAQQAEHEQRVLAEALRDIAALLNSSLDFDDVLDRILTHVARVVPYDAGSILLIKEDVAQVTHARGYSKSILGTCLPFKDVPNLLQVVETGRPFVIDDTHTSKAWVPSPETSWIRSSLAAAIGADEQTIGFISLERETPFAFTSEHVERLQAFANQAGVAIQNARLYASAQQARQTAETLRAANLALTQSLDLDAICDELLGYLNQLVPYDSATIFLLESDTRISAHAVRGYERWVDSSLALAVTFDLEPGSTMHTIVATQKSFLVPDTTQFPAWVRAPSGEHIRCWLGVPMLVGGRVIGVCSLDSTQTHTFTQEQIRLAESLAAQAAFAIQNARLFEYTQHRAAELETLRRSSLQLASSLDLPAVLGSIVESALTLVEATNCHIYLYDEANQTLDFSTVLWKDGRSETVWETPPRDGLTATVARDGRPVVINDATHHPLYTTVEAQEWGIQAAAGLPLKRAERVLGVLNIVFCEPHTISEEELRVLSLLADQAAMAIENARLYASAQDANEKMAQELALAGEVQTSFLPREVPDIPGWQLSVTLKPARETSGDFYDVNVLPNGRVGLLVADVVDKGVGAALYMALSWTLLRTYAAEYPTQPELVFSATNRRILMDTKAANQFVTVFYGILDPATGTLVYCNAGHCPPYLVGAQNGQDARELAGTGVPLGMFANESWGAEVVQLAPGDVLVVYSDGIPEARNEHGAFFEEDRMLASVRANLGRPAQVIQDTIIRDVCEFMNDTPQSDDITLAIVVRDMETP